MIEERNLLAPPVSALPGWGASGAKAGSEGVGLRGILAALDVVAVVAVWLTWVLAQSSPNHLQRLGGVAAVAISTVISFRVLGLYRARVCALRSSETARTIAAALVGAAVFALFERAVTAPSAVPAADVGLLAAAAVCVVRGGFSRWLKARHSAGRSLRTVVLVGTNADATELRNTLASEPELGYRIGAVIGPGRPGTPWEELPGSDRIEDIAALAATVGANGVILVGSALGDAGAAMSEAFKAGLHVQVSAGIPVDSRRLRMTPTYGVPLLYVEPQRSAGAATWALRTKRAMDLGGALLVGVMTAPILAAAALAIKLEDGGPILYRAERVGQHGVPITVFKLRTMVENAAQLLDQVTVLNERTDGPLFKATNDPRTTRVGRALRASSIDELPQLWNVLNGTMSLVGPRPANPEEVEKFDAELRRRHQVRPGITGPWQLEARDNPSFNAYRRYDLAYVDSWSLHWDLSIVVATASAVIVRGVRPLPKLLPRLLPKLLSTAGRSRPAPSPPTHR